MSIFKDAPKPETLRIIFVFLILFSFSLFADGQENKGDNFLNTSIGSTEIIQANLLGNHPLGIYLMRLESNFRIAPVAKKYLSIQLSSANVWNPRVTAYKPLLESDRIFLSTIPWHNREFSFDYNSIPTESLSLHADAVIKGLLLSFVMPLAKHQEIQINLRSYLYTKGKFPFSILSSDQFLEYFHSNIAGGEDPFARRVYGLDRVEMHFIDENEKVIEKTDGDFVIPGLEMHYTYFVPSSFLASRKVYFNIGAHLGINTTSYNPSSDIGISAAFIKQYELNQNQNIQMAVGGSYSLPRWFKWGEPVNINNTISNYTIDCQLSYRAILANKNKWEIGLHYHHQSPYQDPKELEGIILTGERISSHWHYAISHLYENLTVWSLIFNYSTSKYSLSVYASEDLKVNNAPDIQTGIQLSIPF